MRERSISAPDGRTLQISEAGDPGGRAVVMLNGTPSGRLLYGPHVADAERKGIRLIGYDRPGYGGSSAKPGRIVVDAVADVQAIADALEIDRFAIWGTSGGGPHTLACAARLPDRVVAAAALSSSAPIDAEGLDWTDRMGKRSVAKFEAAAQGRDVLEAMLVGERAALMESGSQGLLEAGRTMLTPADAAVMSGELAEFLFQSTKSGIEGSVDGWRDDILAFGAPWGFDVAEIRTPVLLWHGDQDGFVPRAHGAWLAERIPGVEARLSPDEGHITLVANRVPDVHAWLIERF